jgi:hypothetical protein
MDVKWEPSAPNFKHKNLAKLTIYGFQSDGNFMGYIRRVMEAAVNIKEVSLHDRKGCNRASYMLTGFLTSRFILRPIQEALRKRFIEEEYCIAIGDDGIPYCDSLLVISKKVNKYLVPFQRSTLHVV